MPRTTPHRPRTRTLQLLEAHGAMLARSPAALWLGPVIGDWRFGSRRP